MTLLTVVELIASFALILWGATVFVNAIEWLGKRLNLTHGATGSVLAAVGTALPESMIPLAAFLFGGNSSRHDVGVGAILGAPLLLSTIAMGIVGISLLVFSARKGRPRKLSVDSRQVRRDLRFFLVAYAAAILIAVVPNEGIRIAAAVGFVLFFALFVYRTVVADGVDVFHRLDPLKFSPRSSDPATAIIVVQLVFSLLLLIGGAHLFVNSLEAIALGLGIPALILALVIAPLATELPEKLNSVIWIGDEKDTLAMGNLTGAMVFQSTVPVALGVAFTPWHFTGPALVSAIISFVAAALLLAVFSSKRPVGPAPMFVTGILYVGFLIWVLTL